MNLTVILLEARAKLSVPLMLRIFHHRWNVVAVRAITELLDEVTKYIGAPIVVVASDSNDGQALLAALALYVANNPTHPLPPMILRVTGGSAALGIYTSFIARRPIKVFDDAVTPNEIERMPKEVERALMDFADYFYFSEGHGSQAQPPGRRTHSVRQRRASCPSGRLAYLRGPRN